MLDIDFSSNDLSGMCMCVCVCVCGWVKYQYKLLPACITSPSSTSVFDLVAAEPRGGGASWGGQWLGLVVKSPSVNELSAADRSSHTSKRAAGSWAADLLFTLTHYNVFIPRKTYQGLTIKVTNQNIQESFLLLLLDLFMDDTHKHTHTHTLSHTETSTQLSLGSQFQPFDLHGQRSQPIKSLNVNRRGNGLPWLFITALSVSLCVCVCFKISFVIMCLAVCSKAAWILHDSSC